MSTESINKTINDIESHLQLFSNSFERFKLFFDDLEKKELAIDKSLIDLNNDNLKDFKTQLNFGGFLTISILDILVISKNYILSKFAWERLHQLRLGYLLIYSVIETYNLHAQQLKKSAEKRPNLKALFNSVTTELKSFKKQYNYPDTFKEIRNSTIGHIDPDYKTCYSILNVIDPQKSFQAIVDFTVILYKLEGVGNENANNLQLKVGNRVYAVNELDELIKLRSAGN